MFPLVPSMTKSNASWQYTDTRSRIATGCGSGDTGSTRRNPFRLGTTTRTFHRQYSPARHPSSHMSPMHGTLRWKLYSRCAERSGQTDNRCDLYFAVATCQSVMKTLQSLYQRLVPFIAKPHPFSPIQQFCPQHVKGKPCQVSNSFRHFAIAKQSLASNATIANTRGTALVFGARLPYSSNT